MQVQAKQPEPAQNSAELDKIFKRISEYQLSKTWKFNQDKKLEQ